MDMDINKKLEEIKQHHIEMEANHSKYYDITMEAMKEAYELGKNDLKDLDKNAMKYWGDGRFIQGRDKALEWAAENAETEADLSQDENPYYFIDKDSILIGKTAKELQP